MSEKKVSWYSRRFWKVLSFERLLWLSLAFFAVFSVLRYKTVPQLDVPNVILKDSLNHTTQLSELISGPTIVHFYASWCGPCMKELPAIAKFRTSELGQKINWVFITEDNESQCRVFHQRYGMTIYRLNELQDAGVYSIPVTYFFNSEKELVKSDLGTWDWENQELSNELNHLIYE
jgi:thiol-disulfide isomerase/thioredoxin